MSPQAGSTLQSTLGGVLDDIRRYVESLASDSGEYVLRCGRTGDRPVPAAGLTFGTRATARAAALEPAEQLALLQSADFWRWRSTSPTATTRGVRASR
ncbi:DUF7552 domain-containing protein [Natrarchaeobius oligotrophus]